MKKMFYLLGFLLLAVNLLVACLPQEDLYPDTEKEPTIFPVKCAGYKYPHNLYVPAEGDTIENCYRFRAAHDWIAYFHELDTVPEWITLSKYKGKAGLDSISITIKPSNEEWYRDVVLKIEAGDNYLAHLIRQEWPKKKEANRPYGVPVMTRILEKDNQQPQQPTIIWNLEK